MLQSARFIMLGRGSMKWSAVMAHFVVDLMYHSCGCRQWDMTNILCPHAISAILYHSSKPEQYLHQYYSVEYYKMAYDLMIYTVPSEDQWVRTCQDEIDPLVVRAAPGKPKKVRRKGVLMSQEIHIA
jgi:hypothetical protein